MLPLLLAAATSMLPGSVPVPEDTGATRRNTLLGGLDPELVSFVSFEEPVWWAVPRLQTHMAFLSRHTPGTKQRRRRLHARRVQR